MTYKTYLAHHGIKGQKWGIRRFQNKDGTYTEAGQKRRAYTRKDVANMSDEELDRSINRLKKEKQLVELSGEMIEPGRYQTKKVIGRIGTAVLGTAVVGAAAFAGKKAMDIYGDRLIEYAGNYSGQGFEEKAEKIKKFAEGVKEAGRYMFPNPNKK